MTRTSWIQIRVSEETKAEIRARAAAAGFDNLSEYMVRMALWAPPVPTVSEESKGA